MPARRRHEARRPACSWGLLPATILVTVGGCRPDRPPPTVQPAPTASTSASPSEAPLPDPSRPQPAFVVLTDGHIDGQTVVIPIDPATPIATLPGLWVGDPDPVSVVASGVTDVEVTMMVDDPDRPPQSVPVCPSGDFDDPCGLALDLTPDDPTPAITLEAASAQLNLLITRVASGATVQSPMSPIDHTLCDCVVVHGVSTDGEPEPEFDLTDPDTLADIDMSPYAPEEYAEECGEDALRPDYELRAVVGGVVYRNGTAHTNVCNGLNIYDGVHDSWPLRPGATPLALEFPAPVDCGTDEFGEMDADDDACEVEHEWPEQLSYRVENGALVRTIGSIGTVGNECYCESSLPLADACPSPLEPCGDPTQFGPDQPWDQLWVSTDGKFALGVDQEGFAVLARDVVLPLRRIATDALRSADDVLGIEFHAETGLLDVAQPPAQLRPAIPPLDESDADFTGNARQWGNRCFVHFRADRLDAAESACMHGLVVGGADKTRGAITYTLGRIAEARAHDRRALDYYRRSDSLRPGNTAVEARIQALAKP